LLRFWSLKSGDFFNQFSIFFIFLITIGLGLFQKKIIFLNHVKMNLNIRNVDLVHERIENFDDKRSFDSIVCRSFSTLYTIFKNSKNHLLKELGKHWN